MTETQAETQTLRIERTFDVTPEEMWAFWTDPDHYKKWISPFPGIDAEIHEFEAKVGGRIRFTMVDAQGTRYPEEVGQFDVLDKPNRIVTSQPNAGRDDVFADKPMRMIAVFERVGDQTRMLFTLEGLPADFPMDQAQGGFGSCFDQLAELVAAA